MSAPRGEMIHALIVRLAAEGVPMRSIARVVMKPYRDVKAILGQAVIDRKLASLPAADWGAVGPRKPSYEVPPYERIDALAREIQIYLGFTPQHASLTAALVLMDPAPRVQLVRVISKQQDVTDKLVDVAACKVRDLLRPLKVSFETVWGVGYRMDGPSRARLLHEIERRKKRSLSVIAGGRNAA